MKPFLATLVALLAGCAAAPKPAMPETQYYEFARYSAGVYACGKDGYMAPETAALGLRYIQGGIQAYTYDATRIDALIRNTSVAPTQQGCNEAAMRILDRKRQIEGQNAAVAADTAAWNSVINNTRPQAPIYCNRAGTQTVCN